MSEEVSPTAPSVGGGPPDQPVYASDMELRDYFAAEIVNGILASPRFLMVDPTELAVTSYAIADAMMNQRIL